MLIHSCLKFPSFLYSFVHYSKSSTTWWQGNGNTNSVPEVWGKIWFRVVIITFISIVQVVLETKMTTKLFLLKNHKLSCLGNIDFIIYQMICLTSMAIIRLYFNPNKNDTSHFEVALSVLWLLLSFILYPFSQVIYPCLLFFPCCSSLTLFAFFSFCFYLLFSTIPVKFLDCQMFCCSVLRASLAWVLACYRPVSAHHVLLK